MEDKRDAQFPILIGKNVTSGAHSTILAGVAIGDNAFAAAGAVVPKGTKIAPGEIWGGVPPRKIGLVAALVLRPSSSS